MALDIIATILKMILDCLPKLVEERKKALEKVKLIAGKMAACQQLEEEEINYLHVMKPELEEKLQEIFSNASTKEELIKAIRDL
jgi:hypothetical protein